MGDDVELGLNGGAAGLRVGDQLVAVNGEVVIGENFDSVMNFLQSSPSPLELQFYRGNVKSLFTIVQNRNGFDDEEEDEDVVVMDENYVSPVQIDVSQYQKNDDPITPGDVLNAFSKLGSNLAESAKAAAATKNNKDGNDDKKGGGFFGGMFGGGETIQLDGDD